VEAASGRNRGAGAFGHECRASLGHGIGIGQSLEFVVHVAPQCLSRGWVRIQRLLSCAHALYRIAFDLRTSEFCRTVILEGTWLTVGVLGATCILVTLNIIIAGSQHITRVAFLPILS
jgi:hypothetical protein